MAALRNISPLLFTAAYRMTHDAWTADQAIEEMKRYEFLKDGDHTALKNFVFDYYTRLTRKDDLKTGPSGQ